MKIEINPGSSHFSDKISGSSVSARASVSSEAAAKDGSSITVSIPGGLKLKESYFMLLEGLMKILDRKSQVQTSIIPLLQLLKQMPVDREGLPADTADRRLLLAVFRQWREHNSSDLPGRVLSDFETLEKLLQGEGREKYLFIQRDNPEQGIPEIVIREEEQDGENPLFGKEGSPRGRLDLRFNLLHLGPVRVLLEKQKERLNCLIQCEDRQGHKVVRAGLSSLKEQLRRSEFPLGSVKVQKKALPSQKVDDFRKDRERGVTLWG
jgi:hypothetical protein